MRNLKRNKKTIYLCKQIIKDDRIMYEKPIPFKVSVQPLSNGILVFGGDEFVNELTIYTTPEIAKNFNNNDRCYIGKLPPKTHDILCLSADFYVHGEPLTFLNETRIYVKRMTSIRDE